MRRPLTFVAMVAAACSNSNSARGPTETAHTPPTPVMPTLAATNVAEIVQTGAPVLRSRATDVTPERIVTGEMRELVSTMIATMRAAPGVGLAAPQIGVPLRVIVLEDREELVKNLTDVELRERERAPFPVRVFYNPVLKPISAEQAMFFEGCLSVQGFAGLVERSSEVEVSGLDENAEPRTWRVRGWPARILQHEVDHLDGTLYVDRMKTRSFTTVEQAKKLYGGKPISEIRTMLGL